MNDTPLTTTPSKESEKPRIKEIEDQRKTDLSWTTQTDREDTTRASGRFGGLLKRNPSPAFLADVAKLNSMDLDPKEVKRLERKIDLLIIPALSICYMFYYVDKTTLSYAAIFGLKEDLNLKPSEYSWLSSIFYFGWLAWALPTNILMQKFPLSKYLAFNIFMWGVLLMAQAASRNFTDLAILRILSGAFEATADPAFVLITGMWYTRGQVPARIGYWYLANGLGIALGGLLGYGIGHIKSALASWKMEFLIVGALCSGWAIIMGIFIPDSPYHTHWFNLANVTTKLDRQQRVLEAFMDAKIYLFFLFGFTANVPNGGTSNFGTIIVKGFGFNTFQTTLMQVRALWFIISLIILLAIYVNTRLPKGNRTYLMAATNLPTVVGFAMIAWAKPQAARLIGYWMTGASNATFVLGLSIVSGNVGGQTKKAIASASVFLGVAAGNIVGPFLFKDSEALGISQVCWLHGIARSGNAIILVLRVIFVTANRKRDRAVAEGKVEYDPNQTGLEDITDWNNPAFRYITVSSTLIHHLHG
ncbi:major facilitator superfamily domain-containing protein [Mucidula mucida]|nr:major facilitator superfamily domain-containing protein [Mucidula mucida]